MRYKSIDKAFFSENREILTKQLTPGSVAVFFSNYAMQRNGDQYFPYRQNSDFFYLTGIEQARSVLVISPWASQDNLKEVLFILQSNPSLEIWEGHKLTVEEASSISGIRNVKMLDDLQAHIHLMATQFETFFFNVPELPKFMPDTRSWDEVFSLSFKEKYPLHKLGRLAPIMQQLRIRKSPVEIELIRKAIRITNETFLEILKSVKPGMYEYEVEAIITKGFLSRGAQGHAYLPIVAGGKNACTLHYIENESICSAGDLLLLDIGAEYANYASDMSRTIPISGKFTNRQIELYESVLRIFKAARSLVKPGTTINVIHAEVCKLWEEEHIKLGLYTKKQVEQHKGENPLWFDYYMHGTSHFMGLDVHDTGTKDTILEPGMVITCEPAIYIAAEKVGIRLENNLLITEEGNEDLMNQIPIEPGEIEKLMMKS